MKYLILMTEILGAWDALPEAEQQRILALHEEAETELRSSGRFVTSLRLRPQSEARTVRRDAQGTVRVSEGAFGNMKEAVGGFYVVEADSLEEALAWAQRLRFIEGANEVRAIWE